MARLQIEIKDRKYRSNIAWHVSTILFASSTSLKNFLESNTKPFVKRLKDLIALFLGLSDLLSIRNYILIPRLVTNWSKTTNHSALSFLGGYQVWFEKRLASEAGDNYGGTTRTKVVSYEGGQNHGIGCLTGLRDLAFVRSIHQIPRTMRFAAIKNTPLKIQHSWRFRVENNLNRVQ